jgi:hypothetical protein
MKNIRHFVFNIGTQYYPVSGYTVHPLDEKVPG